MLPAIGDLASFDVVGVLGVSFRVAPASQAPGTDTVLYG